MCTAAASSVCLSGDPQGVFSLVSLPLADDDEVMLDRATDEEEKMVKQEQLPTKSVTTQGTSNFIEPGCNTKE